METPRVAESVVADCRFAFRGLRKSPVLALTAIGVLSLALAANSAVFAVEYSGLIRSLPFKNADDLVTFTTLTPHGLAGGVSEAKFNIWKERSGPFADVSAFTFDFVNLRRGGWRRADFCR